MSNVVDFLQRAGESSQLRYATHAELQQALLRTGIAPSQQLALLNADSTQLATLIGSRHGLCGVIFAPQDDEPNNQEPDDKEQRAS